MSKVIDFGISTYRMEAFPVWLRNIKDMSEDDRKSLTIYRKKDHGKFYVTTHKEDPSLLVAKDEKNQFVLDGEKWEVPASTLEILNNPIKTKK